ncbi:hypothetical protein NLG97_g6791 [Lecanicillium saksenae]|uniref:Uncharacterized protein n=1 Tax=Lecanicillium saksenae TaxID=468837 RepID=A0ACC1QQ85_9HYPO|nr:hypothetical protein NLG97_g6791 [Lecanicillium saksenae]
MPTLHRLRPAVPWLYAASGYLLEQGHLERTFMPDFTNRLHHETAPPDWEYMEAIRFYHFEITSVMPDVGGGQPAGPDFRSGLMLPAVFVANVLDNQIARAYKSLGRLPGPDESVIPAGLRRSYHRYALELVAHINDAIQGKKDRGMNQAFPCFITLIDYDLNLGSLRAAMREDPGVPFSLGRILREFILAATTYRGSEQEQDYLNYSDHELEIVFSDEIDWYQRLYPVAFSITTVHISRLRALVARNDISARDLESAVREIFGGIDRVDVGQWAEEKHSSDFKRMRLVGNAFKMANRLYAILTLPRSAILPSLLAVARARDLENMTYQGLQDSIRSELLHILRQVAPFAKYPPALSWPLLVAGVAVVDSDAADREFVDQAIYDIWKYPLSNYGPVQCLYKLREFWSSGKREWEDCFYEPTPH